MSDWKRFFFGEKIERPELLSPLVLAYIGDAVYELMVRRRVITRGFARTGEIHVESVKYVRAEAQASVLIAIEGALTGEEAAIARRGRNARTHTPKGTNMSSYRHSTGLECLIGYLYLKENPERLGEIMAEVFALVEKDEGL